MQAVQCINESLEASAVNGTFPMPSSITQDWVPSRADIKKLVKVKFYQSHNEFIPTVHKVKNTTVLVSTPKATA